MLEYVCIAWFQDSGRSLLSRICCTPWAQWLGEYSLALYLTHEPVRYILCSHSTYKGHQIKIITMMMEQKPLAANSFWMPQQCLDLVLDSGWRLGWTGHRVGHKATLLALKERHLTSGEILLPSKSKWSKPLFCPGKCLQYVSPSSLLLPSWLPLQSTIWLRSQLITYFDQLTRTP